MGTDGTTRSLEQAVFGAPVVPPGRPAVWLTSARRLLHGFHERLAPPPVRILEALFAQLDAHVLRVLVELDVPDQLVRPASMAELADRLELDHDSFERLMRYAAARNFISIDRRGRVRASGITKALQSDAVAPWRGWVRFATSSWFDDAFRHLGPGMAVGGPSPFEAAHGTDFFGYTNGVNPDAGVVFDQAMSAGAVVQAIGLARILKWDGIGSVCDVGGGSGAALDVLQRYHPHLEAVLFDLPEVIGRSDFLAGGQADRRSVGGSFFDEVPAGHDRYLLLAVVHDWDDESAVSLLGNVGHAMGPAATAVVVETPRADRPVHDFAAASDLLMLALASGRERTAQEYGRLFSTAGLTVVHRHLLPSGATAYEVATTR